MAQGRTRLEVDVARSVEAIDGEIASIRRGRMLVAGKLWLLRRSSFSGEIQRVALQVGELDNFEGPFVCCPENHTRRSLSF